MVSAPISAVPLELAVWAALADVHDPEIPAISVVDLGVVRRVVVAPGRVHVELLPTFVGCPAVDLMRSAVEERLQGFAPIVEAQVTFAEPWTSERITPEGRRRLRESGFAPPAPEGRGVMDHAAGASDTGWGRLLPLLPVAECPYCGSRATTLENAFGPTLCRAVYHCTECRQPFEQFKTV